MNLQEVKRNSDTNKNKDNNPEHTIIREEIDEYQNHEQIHKGKGTIRYNHMHEVAHIRSREINKDTHKDRNMDNKNNKKSSKCQVDCKSEVET